MMAQPNQMLMNPIIVVTSIGAQIYFPEYDTRSSAKLMNIKKNRFGIVIISAHCKYAARFVKCFLVKFGKQITMHLSIDRLARV